MSDSQQPTETSQEAARPAQQQQQEDTVRIEVSGQEPKVTSRLLTRVNQYKESLLERPIRYDIISIIFTILILAGGIVGYVTAESTASLVSGVIFAILLAMGTYLEGARRNPYPLLVTLVSLLGLMIWRYTKQYVFMPAGLISLLTIIMIIRHCYLIYLRNRSQTPPATAVPTASVTGDSAADPAPDS